MPQRLEFEEEEFRKEFENLRRLNHPNIVELLGYCYETRHEFVEYEWKFVIVDEIYRALCFEFMHNGSLQEHLDGKMKVLYLGIVV
jgi:interleukin-1 receptor-associated kinase 1/coatomer subunit beta'